MIQWCVSPPHDPRFISRKLLIKFIHNPKATQVLMLGERECANSHSFSFLFIPFHAWSIMTSYMRGLACMIYQKTQRIFEQARLFTCTINSTNQFVSVHGLPKLICCVIRPLKLFCIYINCYNCYISHTNCCAYIASHKKPHKHSLLCVHG